MEKLLLQRMTETQCKATRLMGVLGATDSIINEGAEDRVDIAALTAIALEIGHEITSDLDSVNLPEGCAA